MRALQRFGAAGCCLVLVTSAPAEQPSRSLTLPEAIQLALQKSPDLATARHLLDAARAGIQQADAAFWPRVRVSESYTASDNPVQVFMMTLNQRQLSLNTDFNNPDTTDNLNTHVLATYSLYDGGRNLASRQAAGLAAEANAQTLDAVRNELVFEVTRSFYTIAKARQFVNTATAAVASMESNLTLATNRVAQGTALKTDLLDADVRLAQAREDLVRARSALAISETVFRNAIGVDEKENVTAANEPFGGLGSSQAASTNGAAAAAPSTAMGLDISHRPELLAAQKAVAVAEKQVSVAFGGHLPRVNAFASYNLDSGNVEQFEDSWTAGVSVELDVFDGFLTRGKVTEARANLAAARDQLRKLELALQLEARQAQLNVDEASARLDTTARAVAQADESLQITKERYANGLALLTQLLDAETALTAARQRRAAAEADLLIARAAMDKALGRKWSGSG